MKNLVAICMFTFFSSISYAKEPASILPQGWIDAGPICVRATTHNLNDSRAICAKYLSLINQLTNDKIVFQGHCEDNTGTFCEWLDSAVLNVKVLPVSNAQ